MVCAMLVATLLIFFLPRKYVLASWLAAAVLIPMDQVVVVGGFHFQMLRVLILLGWIKLLMTRHSTQCELLSGGINSIDKFVCLYAVTHVVTFTLLWLEAQAFVNHMGTLYTTLGMYFVLRFFIRDEEDVRRTIQVLAYITAVIAVLMMIEQASGQNLYAFLGGVVERKREQLLVRDNRFRAMGCFQHAILAGTFGATLLPLFIGLWGQGRKKLSALVGVSGATVMTIASVSSTPVLAYVAGIGAICLWPLRKRMRTIRWGIVISLISLHMVMKAPVWALIGRVDFVGGSASSHRYELIDNFIRRFGDWWLLGVKDTRDWGTAMWDIANQYVAIGQDGGLLSFIFFLSTIIYGFKYLGIARKASEGHKQQERFFWAMGATLFSHVVAFFGISYYDQTIVVWYVFLVMIVITTDAQRKTIASAAKLTARKPRQATGFGAARHRRFT